MRLFINSVFDGIRCCWELLRIHGEARKAKPLPSQVPRVRVRVGQMLNMRYSNGDILIIW